MDLTIKDQLFIVCGATSGLGRAVAEGLAVEGARVIAVARRIEKLEELADRFPGQVETVNCDITSENGVAMLLGLVGKREVHGILVNAGGPPAKMVMETTLEDWDQAYRSVLRWKVDLIRQLVPLMTVHKYGRILCIESAAVKQPIENLVLSNSIRLAVVGFIKSLSQEIAASGITLNILAPGFHATAAMERIFQKKKDQTGLSQEEIEDQYKSQTSVGFIGRPEDFGSLAVWLLSPHSRFITGQTISVDGGVIKGVMG